MWGCRHSGECWPLKTTPEAGLLGVGLKLHFLLPTVSSPRAEPGVPLSCPGCVGKQERVGLPATPTRQGRLWLGASLELSPVCPLPGGSLPCRQPTIQLCQPLPTEKRQEVTGRETDAWGTGGLTQPFQPIGVSTLGQPELPQLYSLAS